MKKKSIIAIIALILFNSLNLYAQNLLPKLQKLFGVENVTRIDSTGFKQYYKINIAQSIDHNDSAKGTFLNRILLGFNSLSVPIVMESAAYGITRKYQDTNYKTEVTELLNANQLIVEHRYFGTSIPDSTTFKYLTYKQVSDDFHHIRQKLNAIFPSKWIATGWSKGGDAVFAYKFYYPYDVDATVAYGISLTMEKEDKRFDEFMEEKRTSADGEKLYEDQIYLLKNKERLMPAFIDFVQDIKKYMQADFVGYDWETMYDYGVLNLQNNFWQRYGDYEKFEEYVQLNYEALVDTGYEPKISNDNTKDKLIYLLDAVFDKKMKAHYYQAFSQGGYYGYNEKPFSKYLKQKDYPLNFFAGEITFFDNTYPTARICHRNDSADLQSVPTKPDRADMSP